MKFKINIESMETALDMLKVDLADEVSYERFCELQINFAIAERLEAIYTILACPKEHFEGTIRPRMEDKEK